MKVSPPLLLLLLLAGIALAGTGCREAPGKPGPEPEVPRPENIVDFKTLYGQNCVSCHGDDRQPGAAISLANPIYLAVAGKDTLRNVIANGVPNKLMPPFAQSAGGMLTDRQVEALANGLIATWGKPGILNGLTPPPYQARLHGDAAAGQRSFGAYCARCHGANGEGSPHEGSGSQAGPKIGSIVDPAYLALIGDQELRSIVIGGMPLQGMPNWRSNTPSHPLTDEEVTNIVAWLTSHRPADASAATANTPGPTPPGSGRPSPFLDSKKKLLSPTKEEPNR